MKRLTSIDLKTKRHTVFENEEKRNRQKVFDIFIKILFKPQKLLIFHSFSTANCHITFIEPNT